MINYNIPGFYDHYSLNKFFIELKDKMPQVFYPRVSIGSVYGNFPYCTWDGGRIFGQNFQVTKEQIVEIHEFYHSFNIPLRFIFTNPLLTEEHLHNRFENLVLTICDNSNNEVCVNSPIVEEYIRTNYPSYKIISSTTKCLVQDDFQKEIAKDYYQVCIDYNLNKNEALLEQLSPEEKRKCEFLVNAICPSNCGFRKQHYAENGKTVLSFDGYRYAWKMANACGIKNGVNHPSVLATGNNFSIDEIFKYERNGFSNFKLEGRTLPDSAVLGNYLYYFIKPEYHFEIMQMALDMGAIASVDSKSFH